MWNRQLMTSGRSQMVTTGNCGNWHTVVGEIRWSLMPKTTMDCHSKLVLHPPRNTQTDHIAQRHKTFLMRLSVVLILNKQKRFKIALEDMKESRISKVVR